MNELYDSCFETCRYVTRSSHQPRVSVGSVLSISGNGPCKGQCWEAEASSNIQREGGKDVSLRAFMARVGRTQGGISSLKLSTKQLLVSLFRSPIYSLGAPPGPQFQYSRCLLSLLYRATRGQLNACHCSFWAVPGSRIYAYHFSPITKYAGLAPCSYIHRPPTSSQRGNSSCSGGRP